MTKRFNKDNPRFRDEFGCVNDLLTGESYLCGESGFVGERDALDTAIALCELLNELAEENEHLKESIKRQQDINNECAKLIKEQQKENEQLKSQLYCDDEEGVCNICKHHYLIKDDEAELGYYNSRCKKGHYECARFSLKYCEDFEKEL